MSASLRPLTTAELLDRTFHLYRNNFVLFAGIASVAAVATVAALLLLTALDISPFMRGAEFDPTTVTRDLAIYFGVWALFYMLGASLAAGATIYAVSKVNLGHRVTISESYRNVFPRLGRIILIALQIMLRLCGLAALLYAGLLVLVFILAMIFAGVGGRGPVIVVYSVGFASIITMYVMVIRLYLKYSVAIQSCMLENTRVNDSMKRSTFLTQDYLWRIFLIYLLMGVIGLALGFVFHWPEFLLNNLFLAAFIWQFLATFVANTLSFPISTIAASLYYYDLRIRKEAFDLQLMMESLGQPQDQAAAAPIG